jgi:hypothetical protein
MPLPKINYTTIDHLSEDPLLPRLRYFSASFINPEGIRNCSIRGIKIRGGYETYKDAELHVVKLRERDPLHDIFIGEMGKWCPFNPDPNDAQKQEYAAKELNEMMKTKKENAEKAEVQQHLRKQKETRKNQHLKSKNNDIGLNKKAKIVERLKNKSLENIKNKIDTSKINLDSNDKLGKIMEYYNDLKTVKK